MHGSHSTHALLVARLTPHSYVHFSSKATPVERITAKDDHGRIPLGLVRKKGFHPTKLPNPHLRG